MTTVEQRDDVAPPVEGFRMIRTLVVVAMLSGFLIVSVVQATLPRITENKRRAVERAVFSVLPGATTSVAYSVESDGLVRLENEDVPGQKAYAGFNEAGELVGVALEAAGQGYQDVIKILYGYSPEQNCITGMYVLESKETPGLGDKISKDEAFVANFDVLDVTLNADKTALANPITYVKHGTKNEAWQIDGISGATISSKAIGEMLNESAQTMIPYLREHMNQIQIGQDE